MAKLVYFHTSMIVNWWTMPNWTPIYPLCRPVVPLGSLNGSIAYIGQPNGQVRQQSFFSTTLDVIYQNSSDPINAIQTYGSLLLAAQNHEVLVWRTNQVQKSNDTETVFSDIGKIANGLQVHGDYLLTGTTYSVAQWDLRTLSFVRRYDLNTNLRFCAIDGLLIFSDGREYELDSGTFLFDKYIDLTAVTSMVCSGNYIFLSGKNYILHYDRTTHSFVYQYDGYASRSRTFISESGLAVINNVLLSFSPEASIT
jgi:hypothetical protein